MKHHNDNELEGREVGRRTVLRGMAVATASVGLPRVLRARPSLAQGTSPDHTMVYVYLRGGADGLSFLAPVGDTRYNSLRPNLGLTSSIRYGGNPALPVRAGAARYWHLSPALSELAPAIANGDMAFIPAAGQTGVNTKSHFQAQDRMEYGNTPGTPLFTTGFVSRFLDSVQWSTTPALRGLMVQKTATKSFLRAEKSLAVADLESVETFPGDPVMLSALNLMNRYQGDAHKEAHENSVSAISYLRSINWLPVAPPNGGADYPATATGIKFRQAEALIRSGKPPEVVEIDVGGWDTHESQGPNQVGGNSFMYDKMVELSQAMGVFYRNLSALPSSGPSFMDKTTLVTISEFGRRIRENDSAGTDHGNGGLVMALGGRVNGGIYDQAYAAQYTANPNPDNSPLISATDGEGDMMSLVDYREIFAEIFRDAMGLTNPADVYGVGFSLPSPGLDLIS